jgi:Holliday junction resolvasome RuvABC DNA-binding subunit
MATSPNQSGGWETQAEIDACMADTASAAVSILALGVISTAALRVMKPRPTVIASLPNHAAANAPNHANDAIGALRALGYSKGEAASAVASASAALGPQADTPALVKTALRRAGT